MPYQVRLPAPTASLLFDGSQLAGAIFSPALEAIVTASIDLVNVEDQNHAARLARQLVCDMIAESGMTQASIAYASVGINSIRTPQGTRTSSVLPWAGALTAERLSAELGMQARIVHCTSLMAEVAFVPHPLPECVAVFRVGDGVSCHSMTNGRMLAGRNGLAGELGHVTCEAGGELCGCGNRGCLEAYGSGAAICRFMLQGIGAAGTTLDANLLRHASPRAALRHIWDTWNAGDRYAIERFDHVLDRLAWGLSLAVNLYDPDLIRVDGYVLRDRQAWIDALAERTRRHLIHGDRRALTVESARAGILDILRVGTCWALHDAGALATSSAPVPHASPSLNQTESA